MMGNWLVKMTVAKYISLSKMLCPVQIDRFNTQLVSNQLIHFKSTQTKPRLVQNRYNNKINRISLKSYFLRTFSKMLMHKIPLVQHCWAWQNDLPGRRSINLNPHWQVYQQSRSPTIYKKPVPDKTTIKHRKKKLKIQNTENIHWQVYQQSRSPTIYKNLSQIVQQEKNYKVQTI